MAEQNIKGRKSHESRNNGKCETKIESEINVHVQNDKINTKQGHLRMRR